MRYFDRLHPATAFLYFALILLLTMMTSDPYLVGISWLTGLIFYGTLTGVRKMLKGLSLVLPILLLLTLTNPLFVREGETVLFRLFGRPFTAEALAYGAVSSLMITAVLLWFLCFHEIVTNEKFMFLFGRRAPKTALVLSVIFSLIPTFRRQMREIEEAQMTLGLYSETTVGEKLRTKFRVFSVLLSGALENSAESADSMRARGFGLPGRTTYSDYRFSGKDAFVLSLSLALGVLCLVLIALGDAGFTFYPTPRALGTLRGRLVLDAAYLVLFGSSILTEVAENVSWRILKSKI